MSETRFSFREEVRRHQLPGPARAGILRHEPTEALVRWWHAGPGG